MMGPPGYTVCFQEITARVGQVERTKVNVQRLAQDYESLVFCVLTFLLIPGCLYLSYEPLPDGAASHSGPFLATLVPFLAKELGLAGIDPSLAVLVGSNIATLIYGCYFYLARSSDGRVRLLSLLAMPALFFLPVLVREYVSYRRPDVSRQFLELSMEYIRTLILTVYFLVMDYAQSKMISLPDQQKMIFTFSSRFVSAPGLLALLAALALEAILLANRADPSVSNAFLAGITALILLQSNLTLALFAHPGYRSCLRIEIAPPRVVANGNNAAMRNLLITGVAGAVIGVLAFFAAITVTFVPGVAAIYPAAAFEGAFGAWFGVWGALASYLGLLVAGSAGGWFALFPTGLLLSVSDFLMALAPAVAVRAFGLKPELPNWRHTVSFVLVTLFLGSLPGSLLYNYVNLQLGQLAGWHSYWVAVGGWNLGNLFILAFVGVPLMKYGTPIIKRVDLYVPRFL
jgi:hypothetical protein